MHHHSESVIRLDRCTQLEPSLILLHGGENQREMVKKTGSVPTTVDRLPTTCVVLQMYTFMKAPPV